jgi:hypothetical protein
VSQIAYSNPDGSRVRVTPLAPLPTTTTPAAGSTQVVTPPKITSATILTAQTAAVGTNWVAFASTPCAALELVNTTGTTISYRRNGAGSAMNVLNNGTRTVLAITNANQIEVKRLDDSNTQVTVTAEALVY